MKLPDQIRAVACVCWVGTLGLGMYVGAQDAPQPAGSPGFAGESPEMSGASHGTSPTSMLPTVALLQGEGREKPEAGVDRSAGDSASAVVHREDRRKHTERRVPPRPGFACCSRNHGRDGVGSTQGNPAQARLCVRGSLCLLAPFFTRERGGESDCVTLWRDRGFASESLIPAGSAHSPALVARSQGVRSASGRVAQSLSGVVLREPVPGHYVGGSQGPVHRDPRQVGRPIQDDAVRFRTPDSTYLPYVATAYAVGCILPKFGPEPPAQRMASGEWPIAGLHVAADPSIAFGTVIEAVWQGLPSRLIVGDRGRAIRGRRLDLFVRDCDTARAWGRRTVMARVVEGE